MIHGKSLHYLRSFQCAVMVIVQTQRYELFKLHTFTSGLEGYRSYYICFWINRNYVQVTFLEKKYKFTLKLFIAIYIDVKHYFDIHIYFLLFTKLIIKFLLLQHCIFISDKKKVLFFKSIFKLVCIRNRFG